MSADIETVKTALGKVSPSFCIAKWSGVTIHFEAGTTHSCHHPKVHAIPRNLLASNPSVLHNTPYKIEQRRKMMSGERPVECEYCWRMEDLPGSQVSDRFLKSGAAWSFDQLDEIISDPLNQHYLPRYVEVSFSNTCQFKCSYCTAEYSSSWDEELKKFGNYPDNTGRKVHPTLSEDTNPYVEAFWKWWPTLSAKLHTFRITGGEPLLSPNTFRLLEDLRANPQPSLSIGINSNLGAPKSLMDKFINLIIDLEKNNCVREIIIFPSIDAYGAQAEYIRNGLKNEYFWSNIEKIFDSTRFVKMTIMCTFNALSVTSFDRLFDKVVDLNRRFRRADFERPLLMDISYLRYPKHQTVKVLPPDYLTIMESLIEKVRRNNDVCLSGRAFYELELIKLSRILEYMREAPSEKELEKLQFQFYEFFAEHDRRRNVSFENSFPEMADFWSNCRTIYNKRFIVNQTKRISRRLPRLHIPQFVVDAFYFFVFKILMKPAYFIEYLLVVRLKLIKSDRLKSTDPADYKH